MRVCDKITKLHNLTKILVVTYLEGMYMNRRKKITILVCVLLTTLNIVACGQVKEDKIVTIDDSAASQQESNVQTVVNADSKAKEDETVSAEESAVNEQKTSEQTVENINQKTTDDISGQYIYHVDDSTLSIIADVDGSYVAELTLFRLTSIDDFTGKYENSILTMMGTDAAGNPITAEITFSNGQAVLTFTDSTWKYLENGTQYVFDKE